MCVCVFVCATFKREGLDSVHFENPAVALALAAAICTVAVALTAAVAVGGSSFSAECLADLLVFF